jgi:hypothetical protein
VTTCHPLRIGTAEQDPPDPPDREEAGNGRVDRRHAGTFYSLTGAEGTKLFPPISVAKEWRLAQPDELSIDFIAVRSAVTWRRKHSFPPRDLDPGGHTGEEGEEGKSDRSDDERDDVSDESDYRDLTGKRSRKYAEVKTNAFLNLVPVVWDEARACECCDIKHTVARRVGQVSVVTMPWDDGIKDWISLGPRETLVVLG